MYIQFAIYTFLCLIYIDVSICYLHLFVQYYDADKTRKLLIGGGDDKCDICLVAFGASRRNKYILKATGHGQSTFDPTAHYGSEVCLTL